MTGLQKAAENEQASTFEDQKQSQNGFPFKKIVYVSDLSGEPSYGLRSIRSFTHCLLRNCPIEPPRQS